jgi:rhodanese-related sulfurtransferase
MLRTIGYGALLRLTGRTAWLAPAVGDNPLRVVEADIAARYHDIEHVSPADLALQLARHRDRVVLFDVRTEPEFAISNLKGASRLSPATRSATFKRHHADRVAGKDFVFYCAVGVRSARLASRLQPALVAAGAVRIFNLSGGIFRWHNERRPIVADSGMAERVHPFDAHWARFLLSPP